MRDRVRTLLTIATAAAVLGWGASLTAEESSDSAQPSKSKAEMVRKTASSGQEPSAAGKRPAIPIYRPKNVGKPARTVGGGSRGPGDGIPSLYVLVPDHVAQTAEAQPSLFWYVDEAPPASAEVRFTILDEDGIEPLVDAALPGPFEAGIHRIRLQDFDVKLEADVEYEWSVAIVLDPEQRAKDIVATGWIHCVERPSGVEKRLASAGSGQAAFVFAEEGLWYEAFAEVGDQIQANPGDPQLLEQRAALLRQVGLDDVAKDAL